MREGGKERRRRKDRVNHKEFIRMEANYINLKGRRKDEKETEEKNGGGKVVWKEDEEKVTDWKGI